MGAINWFAFAISMVMPILVGSVYYHKNVFGTAWMESVGMTEEKAKEMNILSVFGISLVMSLLISVFLLNFNNSPGQEGQYDTFQHGAAHGIILSVLLIIPVIMIDGLFEQRRWKYILINMGYWVITLALMGGVMDVMHHWPNVVN